MAEEPAENVAVEGEEVPADEQPPAPPPFTITVTVKVRALCVINTGGKARESETPPKRK